MNAPAISPRAIACEVSSAAISTGRDATTPRRNRPHEGETERVRPLRSPWQEAPEMTDYRKYAAEFLGTFVLVFGGTTAIVAANRSAIPVLLVVPFAFGLALLAGLYAYGEVSGGHYTPAVTIAMFLDRRVTVPDLAGYVAAQILGAIAASLVLLVATSQNAVATTTTTPGAG